MRCGEFGSGQQQHVFTPKELKGGRVKVYGCSPGCLIVSIAVSLFLTLVLNGCIRVLS